MNYGISVKKRIDVCAAYFGFCKNEESEYVKC